MEKKKKEERGEKTANQRICHCNTTATAAAYKSGRKNGTVYNNVGRWREGSGGRLRDSVEYQSRYCVGAQQCYILIIDSNQNEARSMLTCDKCSYFLCFVVSYIFKYMKERRLLFMLYLYIKQKPCN